MNAELRARVLQTLRDAHDFAHWWADHGQRIEQDADEAQKPKARQRAQRLREEAGPFRAGVRQLITELEALNPQGETPPTPAPINPTPPEERPPRGGGPP